MNIYFNYSMDCETPVDDHFIGPADWDTAERSVTGFIDLMEEEGVLKSTTLFVYPDVARKQTALYQSFADRGVELGLHLNGNRYSRMDPVWLGALPRKEQQEAIRMARQDLEDAFGQPCTKYRACHLSGNDDTFPICEDLGFNVTSTSGTGRSLPQFYSEWEGSYPYMYHPSADNRLTHGDLTLLEIPATRAIKTFLAPGQAFDMRGETPVEMTGEGRELFRTVMTENLDDMAARDLPIRHIAVLTHNTPPYEDPTCFQHENIRWVFKHLRSLADEYGLVFTPANFQGMRDAEAISRSVL